MALPPPAGTSPWKQVSDAILTYTSMFLGKRAWNSLFLGALWRPSSQPPSHPRGPCMIQTQNSQLRGRKKNAAEGQGCTHSLLGAPVPRKSEEPGQGLTHPHILISMSTTCFLQWELSPIILPLMNESLVQTFTDEGGWSFGTKDAEL